MKLTFGKARLRGHTRKKKKTAQPICASHHFDADHPNPEEQMSLFKSLRSKLSIWFNQTFMKSRVKTDMRTDGSFIRERNDTVRTVQHDQNIADRTVKEKAKKVRKKSVQDETRNLHTSDHAALPHATNDESEKESDVLGVGVDPLHHVIHEHSSMQPVDNGPPPISHTILQAYYLRDSLVKSIHGYGIDLAYPNVSLEQRDKIVTVIHQQQARLDQLNLLIEKAENDAA